MPGEKHAAPCRLRHSGRLSWWRGQRWHRPMGAGSTHSVVARLTTKVIARETPPPWNCVRARRVNKMARGRCQQIRVGGLTYQQQSRSRQAQTYAGSALCTAALFVSACTPFVCVLGYCATTHTYTHEHANTRTRRRTRTHRYIRDKPCPNVAIAAGVIARHGQWEREHAVDASVLATVCFWLS